MTLIDNYGRPNNIRLHATSVIETKAQRPRDSLIQEASLSVILMADEDSIIEGMAELVYAMQMPKERQPVETETAANTCIMRSVRNEGGWDPDELTTQVGL